MTRASSPKYPTVRNAYIGSVAAGAVAFAYDLIINENFSVWNPVVVGIAAFLGWAIARELDPDHPMTAMLALAGAAILAMWLHPFLLLSFVTLGAVRLLVGTVGGPGPTSLDLIVMVGLSGYAGGYVDGWFLALIITVGILVAGGRWRALWALGGVVAAVLVATVSSPEVNLDGSPLRIVAFPVLLFIVVLLAVPETTTSVTDIGKAPLDTRRLRAARFLAGLAVLGAVLASDVFGLTNLGPLTAAVVATAGSAASTRIEAMKQHESAT